MTYSQSTSQPVCLGVGHPSGTCDQFFFLLEISLGQLRVCYFVARGRGCNLLYNCFWALPEQSLLGRSPAELTAIFCCLIWDSPNLEGQVPVFISPRNRVAQLYPQALGSLFCRLLRLTGQRWENSWQLVISNASNSYSIVVCYTAVTSNGCLYGSTVFAFSEYAAKWIPRKLEGPCSH
jgi:hypothetical protein